MFSLGSFVICFITYTTASMTKSSSTIWDETRQNILTQLHKKYNITCPELNNIVFTNDKPYDILGIPECGDEVKPKMKLYINARSNSETELACLLDSAYLPNNQTLKCFEELNRRSHIHKVVIVTHGFLKNFNSLWLHDIQKDIMATDPGTAVIIVGWGHGLYDILNYWRSAANTRYIGEAIYLIIRFMQISVTSRKLYIHCAGHSLGAHGCAFAGKRLQTDTHPAVSKLNRISGMDPAGPLFANDVAYPFNGLNISRKSRLGPNDARFVDVIHTDGDARYLGYLPQYGTMEPMGDVDFYPGHNDRFGYDQPGCLGVIDIVACSHSRGHQLYAATILSAKSCLARRRCFGDPHTFPNNCCVLKHPQIMGYWYGINEKEDQKPMSFIVETTGQPPFCRGNNSSQIDMNLFGPQNICRPNHHTYITPNISIIT